MKTTTKQTWSTPRLIIFGSLEKITKKPGDFPGKGKDWGAGDGGGMTCKVAWGS